MTDTESIMIALTAFRKTTDTIQLSQGIEAFITTGQQLVGIGLMPDIPDNLVFGRIKDPV